MNGKKGSVSIVLSVILALLLLFGTVVTVSNNKMKAETTVLKEDLAAKEKDVSVLSGKVNALAKQTEDIQSSLAVKESEALALKKAVADKEAELAKLKETSTVTTGSGSSTGVEKSYLVEDVNLSGNFAKIIDSDKLSTLADLTIDYNDESYDVQEFVILHSSLAPKLNVEDFGSDIAIEANDRGAIEYKVEFDTPVNVTSDEDLVFDFLGKELTLTNVGTNEVTLRTSTKYTVELNKELLIGSTLIKAVGFGDSDAPKVLLVVNGKTYQFSEGTSKSIDGVKIKVDSIFVSSIGAYQAADIYVGKDLTDTIRTGDEFEADDRWNWKITSTSAGLSSIGVTLADRYVDKDEVFSLGDSIKLPYDYKVVSFDSLRNLDVTDLKVDVSSDEIRVRFDGKLEIAGKTISPAEFTIVNKTGGYFVEYTYRDDEKTANLSDVSIKVGDRTLGVNYSLGDLSIGTYSFGYTFGVDKIVSGPAILDVDEDRRDVSGDVFYQSDIPDVTESVDHFTIGLVDAEAKEVIVKVY